MIYWYIFGSSFLRKNTCFCLVFQYSTGFICTRTSTLILRCPYPTMEYSKYTVLIITRNWSSTNLWIPSPFLFVCKCILLLSLNYAYTCILHIYTRKNKFHACYRDDQIFWVSFIYWKKNCHLRFWDYGWLIVFNQISWKSIKK